MKTLQGDYGGDSDGFVKPQISNSEFSFGPTSSNARRDQIQRQEPQALNHGQHRDHDRSNYRDERSHKHERDQVYCAIMIKCVKNLELLNSALAQFICHEFTTPLHFLVFFFFGLS